MARFHGFTEKLFDIASTLNRDEELRLSPSAAKSRNAVRARPDSRRQTEYRPAFSLDVDRILHALAYTRYIDKTQVFYLIRNDHITHRVLHVQLVSKIARTIGRFLRLNEDLIEAVALGHDIGHAPFGHDGESFLSDLCREHGAGYFHHNVQSVRFLTAVERKGRGWNLTLQTLDGILCHDGEVHSAMLIPEPEKTFADLHRETAEKNRRKNGSDTPLRPMTMEACVVRIADTISYIGRDIEDAIRLNIIDRDDLPKFCVEKLGDTNGAIVYRLVTDVIQNSAEKPHIAFSPEISEALRILKAFNLDRIYTTPKVKRHSQRIKELFGYLFEKYLSDLKSENRASVIYKAFLKDMSQAYIRQTRAEEIVRDFIAGMTDRYFIMQCPKEMTRALRSP